MPYKLLRRDFVEFGIDCDLLSKNGRTHKIHTGKAYIIFDLDSERKLSVGPNCAMRATKQKLSDAPDYTKAFVSNLNDDDNAPNGKANTNGGVNEDSNDSIGDVIAYLVLRQKPMIQSNTIRYRGFDEYYNEYKRTGSLSVVSINHIRNTMRLATREKTKFAPSNLFAIYAVIRLADLSIRKNPEYSDLFTRVKTNAEKYLQLFESDVDKFNAGIQKRLGQDSYINPEMFNFAVSKK